MRPNLILLITDQQRAPMHWPTEDGWLDELTPADAELRRTGLSFTTACTAASMCSPSRASFLTGTYPSRHGVTLTLTLGDLWPDRRNSAGVIRELGGMLVRGDASRRQLVERFVAGAARRGPRGGNEPELPAGIATIGSRLREAGYEVAYKGKWHLTKPYAGGYDWADADAERLEEEFGFPGWEPPDAGENAKAEHFGAGNAGNSGQGWDEDYIRQVERFLGQDELPEPFCLIVSLVNPHDVLGYPASYVEGGFRRSDFAGMGIPLPPTIDESLREKPRVQTLMKLGQNAYLGALRGRQAQQDYVDFYAYLHGVVDRQIRRLLDALGSGSGSLRERSVIVRFSDHGEMGLSHGGLRQKMFNVYEETMRVPLVVSNPLLFPRGAQTEAPASLVDIVPTLLGIAGAPLDGTIDGVDQRGVLARHADADAEVLRSSGLDMSGVLDAERRDAARDHVLFTYDDHQAGTAQQEAPGQPNRIRCVRDGRWKYAVYLDPRGRAEPEYELYDLVADPTEVHNLVEVRGGRPRAPGAARERLRLAELLREACQRTGTASPALPD